MHLVEGGGGEEVAEWKVVGFVGCTCGLPLSMSFAYSKEKEEIHLGDLSLYWYGERL